MSMKINLSDLVKMINEAIMEAVPQPVPVPVGGGAPKPIGGNAPTPIGGAAPKPVGGGAPKPVGGGAPKPVGGGVPTPVGGGSGVPSVSQISPAEIKSSLEEILEGNAEDANASVLATQTDVGESDDGFKPAIVAMQYGNFYEGMDPEENNKESLKLYIGFVTNQTREKIVKAINANYDGLVIAKDISEKDANNDGIAQQGVSKSCSKLLKFAIYPGKNQEFINNADSIVDIFYKFSPDANVKAKSPAQMAALKKVRYAPSFKTTFAQRLKDFVNKSVSNEDFEKAQIRIAENWVTLLSDLSNPAVIEKIGKVQGLISDGVVNGFNVFGDNGKASGWQLSIKNKSQIIIQDPGATYVCEEFVWRDVFNHEVIDRNKFIMVTKPSYKTVTAADMNTAAIDRGYQGGNSEFKTLKSRGEVSPDEKLAVMNRAKQIAQPGQRVRFEFVKMYDVANTRPIPGMESRFLPGPNQLRGLKDRLEGIPNDAAKKFMPQPTEEEPQTPEEIAENDAKKLELIKDALIEVVRYKMQTGGPEETGNVNQDIINYTYAYGEFIQQAALGAIGQAETAKAFVLGFSAAVSYSIGVPNNEAADYLNRSLHNVNIGKDAKLKDLIIQWHNEYVDFMELVLKNANVKIKRAIKAGELTPNTQKVAESMENGTANLGVHIMSLPEYEKMFGVNDSEQIYEEEDETPSPEMIQESFFRFLDRMDSNGRI